MFTMSRYHLCFLHLSTFYMKDVEVCEEVARYINDYIYKQLSENNKGTRHFGSVHETPFVVTSSNIYKRDMV